jgi:hypothetical protein
MKKTANDDRDLAVELDRYRLVSPSSALKARVLGTAQEAWAQADEPSVVVFWTPALLRFAAAAAAAILLVCGANLADRVSLAHWQPMQNQPIATMRVESTDFLLRDDPAFARLTLFATAHREKPTAEQIEMHMEQFRMLMRASEVGPDSEREEIRGFPQSRSRNADAWPDAC